jgi:hypothetical protein
MSKAYEQINRDTEAAKRGIVPPVLTDTYGPPSKTPAAARFGVGTSSREGAQEAQDARRTARPGDYDSTKR